MRMNHNAIHGSSISMIVFFVKKKYAWCCNQASRTSFRKRRNGQWWCERSKASSYVCRWRCTDDGRGGGQHQTKIGNNNNNTNNHSSIPGSVGLFGGRKKRLLSAASYGFTTSHMGHNPVFPGTTHYNGARKSPCPRVLYVPTLQSGGGGGW